MKWREFCLVGDYKFLLKIDRGDSLNYLGYKRDLQMIQSQKVQIRREQLQTLNGFQQLLGDINWPWPTVGLTAQTLSNFRFYNVMRT